jgi:diphthamide biosynthesis protein 2
MTDKVQLHAPPVLSTPETHIFKDLTPLATANNEPRLTDKEIWSVYKVECTVQEISKGG